jgi:antitoxin CptB
MYTIPNNNQILWQCRRGMLELDNILIDFFQNNYAGLSSNIQQDFRKLLQQSDADLFDWLLGKTMPIDNNLRNIVLLINNSLK